MINKDTIIAAMHGRWHCYFAQFTTLVQKGNQWRGPCPIHGGKGINFAVNADTGEWYCHSQCQQGGDGFSFIQRHNKITFAEAIADVGNFAQIADTATPATAAKRKSSGSIRGRSTLIEQFDAEYNYTDENEKLLFQVVRYDPKDFRQRRSDGKGGWLYNLNGVRRVLYNLSAVAAVARTGGMVFITEGEKDVRRLCQEKLTATCNPGGAGKWKDIYSEALRGAAAIILADNDSAGRNHADQVAHSLYGEAASIQVINLPGLPEKGDVSDWLDAGGTAEELLNIVQITPRWMPEISIREVTANLPAFTRAAVPPSLDSAAMYGLAGDFVRAIEPHTEADPVALLIQFLVAFGSVVGRNAHFMAEWDEHYGNLFAVLVGQSSKARKGTSWGYIKRLFKKVDPIWADNNVRSGLSSGEGLVQAVRDEVEKDFIDDTGEARTTTTCQGVDDKRLLVQESEFASILKVTARDGNTLSAILRNFWDSGDAETMTKKNAARATGAHVSIVGHITRDELRRELSSTESGNGFGNRFLWFFVRRSKELPEGGSLHLDSLSPLVSRLKKVIDTGSAASLIKRNEQARHLWCSIYHDLSEGKPGLAGALSSRAEAQVMRMALLYALLDASPDIQREHLEAALALWEYSEASVRYIFGESLGDGLADKLWDHLRELPDGLTRTQIRDLFQKNQTSERISQALSLLEECGRAKYQTVKTGGRPTEKWFATSLSTHEALAEVESS